MVDRRYRLAAAGAALLLGTCLAWPLRRPGGPLAAPAAEPATATTSVAAANVASPFPAVTPTVSFETVPAIAASTVLDRGSRNADEPAIPAPGEALAILDDSTLPTREIGDGGPRDDSPADARPIYAKPGETFAADSHDESKASNRVHIVHNGDTLQRLAERYLGDETRALEIFDQNRDVLANPHLLPIGAELRIPGAPPRD